MKVCENEKCSNKFEPKLVGHNNEKRYCSNSCQRKHYMKSYSKRPIFRKLKAQYRQTENGKEARRREYQSRKKRGVIP